MLLKSDIEEAYKLQQSIQKNRTLIERTYLHKIRYKDPQIEVISGIRRSGKSTLMLQIMDKYKNPAFFNFEDPRVFGFDLADFQKLDEIMGTRVDAYFFDEVQNVDKCELFVRQLHNKNKKVFITGSNAAMLSKDLGTRLTGRHIRHELFPFSYEEYLIYQKFTDSSKSFDKYLKEGGMPEFLRDSNPEILQTLLRDIVFRDISVKYNIKNSRTLMDITLYLLSNIGKEFSFNSLKNSFSVGSATTVSDYLTWLEDSYLLFYLPRFSWSSKNRSVNPRKVYAIDNGLVHCNTLSFSEDKGRLLENAIYLSLKQHSFDLFYFKEKVECDFVVFEKNKLKMLVQVCSDLNPDNKEREINGLLQAMTYFDFREGYIVTSKNRDEIKINGNRIYIIPANEFCKII